MPDGQKPSYWAVLPATVRYDAELPPNAKLLWAEISALCDTKGYCFASNKYFAQNFELDTSTIQRLIKALADRGYGEKSRCVSGGAYFRLSASHKQNPFGNFSGF